MALEKKSCCPLCVLVFLVCISEARVPISFSSYCSNNTNPSVIPGDGSGSSGTFFLHDRGSKSAYEPGLNCSVTLTVESNYELLVIFTTIGLRNSSMDSLKVIYGTGQYSLFSGQQECPKEDCEQLIFESGKNKNNMTFEFYSANFTVPKDFKGFRAIYTAFDYTKSDGRCRGKNRFLCLNSHCITKELMCNGHNNCGDYSDETLFCSLSWNQKVWAGIVIAIAVVSLIVFVPIFCFLARYGTRAIGKPVTLPSRATQLYPTVDDGEATALLSSSGAVSGYWSSGTFDRRHTSAGDSLFATEGGPSTSGRQRSYSFFDKRDS